MICEGTLQTNAREIPKEATDAVFVFGQRVRVDRTPQHLGGTRAWFLCPACGRRCAILYPVKCRKCMGLHYRLEHLSPYDRATLRAQRLRMSLGGTANLTEPIPPKPKWMRWNTYFARREQIKVADQRHLEGMIAFAKNLGLFPRGS